VIELRIIKKAGEILTNHANITIPALLAFQTSHIRRG
jgi:hypothetical protein